ncbi:MAG TPA: transketolase [Blastocatellia bacterium]|nr:transketolase [Blastocatellia bacterium]
MTTGITSARTREVSELEEVALKVREHIIRMSTAGGCFLGASMSCTDLLVYLYKRVLRVAPQTLQDADRDYLFLSKGHAVPALYATLAETGFLDRSRLANHLKSSDSIYWHPNRSIPGVELHAGSLGHLLAVGLGVAMDIKLRGSHNRSFVILGDGELNEGSVWEAILVAGARKMDNLIAIIDRNGFQANLPTEELVPLGDLGEKLRAFGWRVETIDGHSFAGMERAFDSLPAAGKPTAVIAETVRGKGVRSIEGRADRWFADFTEAEVEMLVEELREQALPRPSLDGNVI